MCLHLFSAPASVRFTHVLWWFDRGNELEDDISNTYDTNNGSKDNIEDVRVKKDGADEDINLKMSAAACLPCQNVGVNIQIPRPMKEKRKEAYREI